MNEAGLEVAHQYFSQDFSALEYRKQLVHSKNMSMLCHCSSKLTQSTILYFSVNNLFLSPEGTYYIMLFSNITPPSDDENAGLDLYGRTFAYAPVKEVIERAFTEHYTFYITEMDGYLVVILCLLHGMIQALSDFDHYLIAECNNILLSCKQKYDLDIAVYFSGRIQGIPPISIAYYRLINASAYHAYIGFLPTTQVINLTPRLDAELSFSPYLSGQALADTILNGAYCSTSVGEILFNMTQNRMLAVDQLISEFKQLFNSFCDTLVSHGLSMNIGHLGEELFYLSHNSVSFSELSHWLQKIADHAAERYTCERDTERTKRLENIRAYALEHLKEVDLTVSSIAEMFQLNQTFLSTIFKKQYGISLSAFIQSNRLQLAHKLLNSTDLTMREICARTGFGSVETFYRAFKEKFGTSPGKMRHITIFP